MQYLFNAQKKLLTVETVTKALIVQFQFIWRYNSVLSFTQNSWKDSAESRRATGILFQLCCPEMANACGPSVLFEMLEQLNRRALQNVDDAAQAPWRPTRSCRSSMKSQVHAGICALGHTS